ncbi:MAG: protoporphyrinogen oxidase, partial [Verrucomicrobia bacterium]|nr:protoporphyrinogen oxidase [Verrucomicrobiota bacterium]
GGYMETCEKRGSIIERGPHIFKKSRNQEFLELIEEIEFSSELITSSKFAKQRYLWFFGQIRSVKSVIYKALIKILLLEWSKPKVEKEETIWEFACRRFGKEIAENLFDPMVLGIYGGDSKKLSVDACFPIVKKWEKEKGSITRGFISFLLQKKTASKGLFSFKKGVGSFIEQLRKKIPFPILYEKQVHAIEKRGEKFCIFAGSEIFEADRVIVALPSYVAASLIQSLEEKVAERLFKIPYESITSVNVVLEGDPLKYSGFGYLIPSKEQETILGVIFDSKIFPDQDVSSYTKITLMMRGCDFSEEEIKKAVIRSFRHLDISQAPKEILWKKMPKAIPQFVLGHKDSVEFIRKNLPQGIYLVGNYLEGVSVNDAIRTAKNLILFLK